MECTLDIEFLYIYFIFYIMLCFKFQTLSVLRNNSKYLCDNIDSRINSQVGPLVHLNLMSSSERGPTSGIVNTSDSLNQRAIKVRFVNNFTAESPLPLFWPGTVLDNAKIVLRNNMMTLCIIMLSLPTTIMNIYVYITGTKSYSKTRASCNSVRACFQTFYYHIFFLFLGNDECSATMIRMGKILNPFTFCSLIAYPFFVKKKLSKFS